MLHDAATAKGTTGDHVRKNAKDKSLWDISRQPLRRDPLPKFLKELCELADSPRSLCVWLLFVNREYEQLVKLGFDAGVYEPHYHDCRSLKLDYLVSKLLSKFSDFDLGIDKAAVAFEKWLSAEARCKLTNSIFRSRWNGSPNLFPHHVEEVLHLARRKMRDLLGSVDDTYIRSHCHFGPGADLSTKGRSTAFYNKFASPGDITPWIIPLYDDIFSNEDSDFRGEYAHSATLCSASRLSFVPKTALVDRAICVEPRWNVYLQLGIGELIAHRLKRVGIFLEDQTSNQDAAQRAYADGLATIDLSSASDSISTNLVIDLLSECDPRWLDLLLKSRCPYTSYQGIKYRLEKISSMGNGFTFPLETLIFYCLSQAAVVVSGASSKRRDIRVYGDDIIVPAESATLLIESLSCVGFETNVSKTFTSGYFYESCGKDFYRGSGVRPFFIKGTVKSVLDGITLVNQISAYAVSDYGDVLFANRELWHLRSSVIQAIPERFRLFGPPEGGSGVMRGTFDLVKPPRAKHGWEGYIIRAFVTKTNKTIGYSFRGHLFSKLSADLDSKQTFVKRGDSYWTLGSVYVPTYTDVMLI